jgi:hypothetical protein
MFNYFYFILICFGSALVVESSIDYIYTYPPGGYVIPKDQIDTSADNCSKILCERFCKASGGGFGKIRVGASCTCERPMNEICSLHHCSKHCTRCGEHYTIASCLQNKCFCGSHDKL